MEYAFPCGKCVNCKNNRINQWVFRLKEEQEKSCSSYFITLTYDQKNIPRSKNGYRTLKKSDLQDFFKSLRYFDGKTAKVPIRYFACGEYGEMYQRPHYHVIVFNVLNRSSIEQAWTNGYIDYGTVTTKSIAYTLKYIDKNGLQKKHSRDDRLPEFQTQSKGIGLSYLTPDVIRYHLQNPDKNYCMDKIGNKYPLPRYYAKKIFVDELDQDRRHAAISKAMQKLRIKRENWLKRQFGDLFTLEQYESLVLHQKQLKFQRYQRINHKRKTF